MEQLNEVKIRKAIAAGHSYITLARLIGSTEWKLRRYLMENMPELMDQIKQNGIMRQKLSHQRKELLK